VYILHVWVIEMGSDMDLVLCVIAVLVNSVIY
jgi:hypothetical protein